jgi:valyl-tRNA synthetase
MDFWIKRTKMSKRLGNAADPFETLAEYGRMPQDGT